MRRAVTSRPMGTWASSTTTHCGTPVAVRWASIALARSVA